MDYNKKARVISNIIGIISTSVLFGAMVWFMYEIYDRDVIIKDKNAKIFSLEAKIKTLKTDLDLEKLERVHSELSKMDIILNRIETIEKDIPINEMTILEDPKKYLNISIGDFLYRNHECHFYNKSLICTACYINPKKLIGNLSIERIDGKYTALTKPYEQNMREKGIDFAYCEKWHKL